MDEKIYSGQLEVRVDSKGRIAIPSKQREILGEVFHISLSLQNCLYIFDTETFKYISKQISAMPLSRSAKIARRFNAFSFEVKPDGQGRIVIPPLLRNKMKMETGDEIVVAGLGAYIEVWHKEDWESAAELSGEESETYADFLSFGRPENANE